MSKKEKLVICGVVFTHYGTVDKIVAETPARYGHIYDAYKRPSTTKIDTWNFWKDYFYSNFKVKEFSVRSRNVSIFTIKCVFEYRNTDLLAIIYPTHNDLFTIV